MGLSATLAGAVLLLSVLMISRLKYLKASFLMLAAFLFGYALTVVKTDRLHPNHFSNQPINYGEQWVSGKVVTDPIERAKSVKVELEVDAMMVDSSWTKMNGKIIVYLEKDSSSFNISMNDRILVLAWLNEISPPQNPGEFNYRRYMHFHQISHQAYVPSGRWKIQEVGSGWMRSIKQAQHRVIEIISSFGISDREMAIISALLVGYKHHLSVDQVNAFASAGAMHVLAVSGLHVGIVFLIVNTLFKTLERLKHGKYLKAVLLLCVLWGYAALTGLSPSVTRASTMFSFVIVGQVVKRHTDIFNTIATSAVFLLILNPFLIVEVGFQLSYLAVLGIVLLQPRIYELWQPQYWLFDKIWAITAVSIAAQVATFPLGLLYFHQFPNYFLLSNLVVIPAATFILPLGISLVAFSWVPHLSDWLGKLLYWMVHLLDVFIQWVEQLPFALILGVDISIFETYFIYMIITTAVMFLITHRFKWLLGFMVMLCCIELLNIVEAKTQKEQSMIVFYKVKGFDPISIIDGHDQVFLADTAMKNNFDRMRFHIHHHWWQLDLNEPKQVGFLPGVNNHLLDWQGKSILALDDAVVIDSVGEVDLLWIKKRTNQHPIEILERVKPDQVLLSTNIDWKSENYWENLLLKKQISFHSMRADGAFVFEE